MIGFIIRCVLAVASLVFTGLLFYNGYWGWAIVMIFVTAIVGFSFFRNENMILALNQMRLGNTDKAKKYINKITYPQLLPKKQHAYVEFLQAVLGTQELGFAKSEQKLRKAISMGLRTGQDNAVARMHLAGICAQTGRGKEALSLLAEAKKLDSSGMMKDQITQMQKQLKVAPSKNQMRMAQMMGGRKKMPRRQMSENRLYTTGWEDYELIDAGGGKKLERWGKIITIRPEVQAYFKSGKPFTEWNQLAHWEFVPQNGQSGKWKSLRKDAPEEWTIGYQELQFNLKLTKFKHLGLFPEQRTNWDFISENIQEGNSFLNLFAYTGAASIVARNAGAETIHVDSVKQLISWASENMEKSNLSNIKWVHEDALKFVQREVKRGNRHQGIIMDPPAWGIGAKNEKWKLEDKIDELLDGAAKLIGNDGFLILNTYSPKVELAQLKSKARFYFRNRTFEVQELWMKTTTDKDLYFGNVLRVCQRIQTA